ncbi:group II intron reverse transcriptase/maturase [Paraliomyxa miuraensis]|nr:group II intron reverse transcriptase/maturase [Paraliomyxa miuraensis]
MTETRNSATISTKQRWIAEVARRKRDQPLTPLAHHIDLAWLREAHRRTRPGAAPGIDGVIARDYEREIEEKLVSLLDRAKSGRYRAPPVRRVLIPKGEGATRPIGIPTHEDKVLQRAVVMLLEPIYEQEFYDFSYGFRPGRSAHDALAALRTAAMRFGGGWVLDVDVSSFFDTIDHGACRALLRRRVGDGVVERLVGKWLRAGVLDGGVVVRPDRGTPQGGVISPMLANIYLHDVLDAWWVQEAQPRLRGRGFLVRFADDFVILFEHEEDARRVQAVLAKRFARFGLRLHPDKTRMVDFTRPRRHAVGRDGRPETFDFLGFTHFWGKSRRGRWIVRRKTMRTRLSRSIIAVDRWCRLNRHQPVAVQSAELGRKLRGHYAYYGLRGNADALGEFHFRVRQRWRKWLSTRSQRGKLSWKRFMEIEARHPLPRPRITKASR